MQKKISLLTKLSIQHLNSDLPNFLYLMSLQIRKESDDESDVDPLESSESEDTDGSLKGSDDEFRVSESSRRRYLVLQ